MFINSYYNSKTSTMHVWESIDGKDVYSQEYWVPYVFISTPVGKLKTIEGLPASKKDFNNYQDYYYYCKDYHDNIYENNVRPEIQYLTEKYHNIPDNDIPTPKLKIYYIDIEINSSEGGFPHAYLAEHPICLISVKDSITGRTVTFGEKEYTGESDTTYVYCPNEKELLRKFFAYMNTYPPHVISGWNIWNFDIPYLINRDKKINNGIFYCNLSPIKVVRTWHSKKDNSLNIDIAGVTILDYMDLYKWYSPNKLERYSLEYVSQFELGKGKLDYSDEAEDLRELYNTNWNKYVDYNVIDCQRVNELGRKLGYIRLVQSLSLLTRVPMRYYNAMTSLIEGALLVHYRRNGLCAPYMMGGHQEYFEAAYVKEPLKGMWSWLFNVDIQSSYPSHIITLNMSTETYFGRIIDIPEEWVIKHMETKEFPPFRISKPTGVSEIKGKKLNNFNQALKRKIFSIAPCGTIFSNGKPGVLSTVERNIFEKRIEIKKLMNDAKGNERERYFVNQHSLKIILNAMFGITAVPYSRYFNVDVASAITSCGRHTIKSGEKFVNEYMNKVANTNKDYVIYADTDSLYIKMDDFCKQHLGEELWQSKTDEEKVVIINELSEYIKDYINERTFNEIQMGTYNSIVEDFYIKFEKEKIAKTGIFIAKKKYAVRSLWVEGKNVDKISITGLEVIRGDSSEAIRYRLKDIMFKILRNEDEDMISKKINEYKKELMKVSPEEIAANIGVNNIEKWVTENGHKKGTPWHVKGVINYRKLLSILGISNKYEDINEGVKVKVVYVKPNKWDMETISFYKWPKEFNKVIQIDMVKMIDKFFLNKINMLLEPINKLYMLSSDSEEVLELFFS